MRGVARLAGGVAGGVAGFGELAAFGFQRLAGRFPVRPCGATASSSLRARFAGLLAAGVEGFDQLREFAVDAFDAVARRFQLALLALQLAGQFGHAAMGEVQRALRVLALLFGGEQLVAQAASALRSSSASRFCRASISARSDWISLLAQQRALLGRAGAQHAHPAGAQAFAAAGDDRFAFAQLRHAGARASASVSAHVQAGQQATDRARPLHLRRQRGRRERDVAVRRTTPARGGLRRVRRAHRPALRAHRRARLRSAGRARLRRRFPSPTRPCSFSPTRAALSRPRAFSHAIAAPCSWPSAACCRVSSEDRRPRAACAFLRTSASSDCAPRCWSCKAATACLRVFELARSARRARPSGCRAAAARRRRPRPARPGPARCARWSAARGGGRRPATGGRGVRCGCARHRRRARLRTASRLCASQRCCQSASLASASRRASWRALSSSRSCSSCGSASATASRSTSRRGLVAADVLAQFGRARSALRRARAAGAAPFRAGADLLLDAGQRAADLVDRRPAPCSAPRLASSRRTRPVSSSRSASRCSAISCCRRVSSCDSFSRKRLQLARPGRGIPAPSTRRP